MQKIVYEKLGVTIFASLNTPKEELLANIKANIQRDLPQVWPHQEQDTPIALVAGGPSLAETLDELRECQKNGAKVVALANTAKYLMDHGIKPSAHVLLDAKPNPEWIIGIPDCTYFLASQCAPVMFDRVEGKRALIWHAVNNTEEFEAIGDHYDKWVPIQGGNTISLRAFNLFSVLGYHTFEVFGMDGCLIGDKHHVYKQPKADDDKVASIECNGKRFKVTAWMVQQAMEFLRVVKLFGQGWQMTVHGDGLIAHMVRTGGK